MSSASVGTSLMPVYVSSVTGSAVGRLGTHSATRKTQMIGARWDRDADGLVWDEDEVVVLSDGEYVAFKKHYDGSFRRGELVRRDEAAFKLWLAKTAVRSERDAQAATERKALRAKAAVEALEAEKKKAEEAQHVLDEQIRAAGSAIDERRARVFDFKRQVQNREATALDRQLEAARAEAAKYAALGGKNTQKEAPPGDEPGGASVAPAGPAPGRGKKGTG